MKANRLGLKIVLSAFIIFHLLSIFVLPNPGSIVYRALAPAVVTYGSLFGLNTTWRFFSPNPLVRIVDYDVFSRTKDGELEMTSFHYPLSVSEEKSRENYHRKLNSGLFLALNETSLNTVLRRKLCEWHPDAESISLYLRGRVFPTIEQSQFFMSSQMTELGEVTRQHLTDINCQDDGEAEGVSKNGEADKDVKEATQNNAN